MKKLLLFALCMIAGLALSAQNVVEAVYLNNGSVIKGVITEQTPQTIKIQTSDGSVFVYNMTEVERIAKEQVSQTYYDNDAYSDYSPDLASDGMLKNVKRRLLLNGVLEISDEELKSLIGENNYELYQSTKPMFARGDFLFKVGLGITASGAVVLSLMPLGFKGIEKSYGGGFIITGSVLSVLGIASLSTGLAIRAKANKRINSIADEYNKSLYNKQVSYVIEPCLLTAESPYGNSVQAFGATFRMNF